MPIFFVGLRLDRLEVLHFVGKLSDLSVLRDDLGIQAIILNVNYPSSDRNKSIAHKS
ncbi:MAG: hypothetical protein ACI9NY_000628 [Kiritimatiellia bacterium]|jgi:hypothetical protein